MGRRWMAVYLVAYLSVPCGIAFLYLLTYQTYWTSPHFYPFWLGEFFFYPILPAVAFLAWKVHWGKKHPFFYWLLSLVLLAIALWIGSQEIAKKWGEKELETVLPLGFAEEELLSNKGTFTIAYFPYDKERLTQAILEKEEVTVWTVKNQQIILSFTDPSFSNYSIKERIFNLVIALLAIGVFAAFLWVVLNVWTRRLVIGNHSILIIHWGRSYAISLAEIIYAHWSVEADEMTLETEADVFTFPYEKEKVVALNKAFQERGLIPMEGGNRWLRGYQFKELVLQKEQICCLGEAEWILSYQSITCLTLNDVIHIATEEDVVHTITDLRYVEAAWFLELAYRVKTSWENTGFAYNILIDQSEGEQTYIRCDDISRPYSSLNKKSTVSRNDGNSSLSSTGY